jgi:hypothetical protein
MKIKVKHPKVRPRSRWEQQIRKNEEYRKKLRRWSCGETEIDGEAWLLDKPHKVVTS